MSHASRKILSGVGELHVVRSSVSPFQIESEDQRGMYLGTRLWIAIVGSGTQGWSTPPKSETPAMYVVAYSHSQEDLCATP